MLACLMTINTKEVVAPHMHINIFRWIIQMLIEITMFYTISTSTREVAVTAVLSGWRSNTLSSRKKINAFQWYPRLP